MAEWSKALAWKVSMGQKPIEGSNPSVSATYTIPRDPRKSLKAAEFCGFLDLHRNL